MWISITALMLLSTAAMAAGTQYCGTSMTSSTGWTGQYNLSIEKSGSLQTIITVSVENQQITGFYQFIVQNTGGGTISKTLWNPGDADFSDATKFSVSSDKKSATITLNWTIYPTSAVQFHMVYRRNNSATFGGGSDIFGNTVSNIDASAACSATPQISATPSSLTFLEYNQSKTISVSAANLTDDITVTCPTGFESSVSTISKSETFPYNVTITAKTSTQTTGNVSFASTGVTTQNVAVEFHEPQTIVFTNGSSIAGAGVGLVFNGYGTTYEKNTSKYTATVKSTNKSITSITPLNPEAGRLFCSMNAAPGVSDVTTISLTYENGDCGKVTFVGTSFSETKGCGATMNVNPSSLSFTATSQQKTFNVSGEDLTDNVTITSNSADFTVSPASINKNNLPADVTVTFVGTATASSSISVTSGSLEKSVSVSAELQPTIMVDPASLSFNKLGSKTISVTGVSLTNDIAVTSSHPSNFTVSPAVISKDASFPVDVTVTCIDVDDIADGYVSFTSTGASTVSTAVTVTEPETIVFTNSSTITGNQAKLVFTGYGSTYAYNKSKYSASVKSTCPTVTSITVQDAPAGYLYCPLSAGPAATDITIITLEYENGDCGKVFFEGGTFLQTTPVGPSLSIDPTSLSYTAKGQQKSFTVIADVDENLTITSSSANFTVSQASITAGTVKSTINVTFNGDASEDAEVIITGAGFNETVTLSASMQPTITVDKSSLIFDAAGSKTISVGASSLTNDVSLALSGTGASYFTLSQSSISKSATFPVEITVNYLGEENATAILEISSTGAETQSVSLTGYNNTACSGYLVATGTKDIPLTYSISETTNGQVVIEFTFAESVTGISPQIYFEDTNIFRTMTSKGGTSYTLTTDDQAVTASPFKYKGYFPIPGGVSQTSNVTYTKGSCDVYMVRIGGKSYTTLAAALDDYTTGSTIEILGDINESNSIEEYVKFNANNHSIGNITVGTSGKLEFMTNGASIGTLIVQSVPNVGAGQIVTNNNTVTATEAYLERQVYSGSYQQYWYSFGVPFTVDARNGVYSSAGSKLSYGTYYIQKYDGAKRAEYGAVKYGQTGYAWSEVETLEKGVGYMIYIASQGINTLRFKATTPSEVFSTLDVEPVMATKYTGSAAAADQAWNFMAQPRMQNAELQSAGPAWGGEVIVQVLNNGGNDEGEDSGASFYSTASSATLIMSPFTTFMFQPSATGALNFLYNSSAEPTVKSAEAEEYKYFIVELSDAAGNSDNLFASASEDASEDGYQIGRDLVKSGSSDANLQICAEEFGLILTANDARAYDGVAEMALRISAPKAGNYSIKVTRAASSGEIYLTKNGAVVADLTEGDAYQFAAPKGVSNQYGLRIELDEDFATSASDADAEAVSVYAQGGTIYVNGAVATDVLNILGQSVVNPVAASGVYLVNAGGKYVKINVE